MHLFCYCRLTGGDRVNTSPIMSSGDHEYFSLYHFEFADTGSNCCWFINIFLFTSILCLDVGGHSFKAKNFRISDFLELGMELSSNINTTSLSNPTNTPTRQNFYKVSKKVTHHNYDPLHSLFSAETMIKGIIYMLISTLARVVIFVKEKMELEA